MATSRPMGRLLCFWLVLAAVVVIGQMGWAAGPARTVVADVVYRADGSPASGKLLISWTAFSTERGEAVAAGQMSATIGAGGVVNVALVPNTGSVPKSSYKVVLKLDDGTTSEEYWTVPNSGTTTIAAIRSKVMPAAVAQQSVSRDYVDTKVAQAGSVIVDSANVFTKPQTIGDLVTKHTPVVDVRAFGANGVAGMDNTAAVQAAIDAAMTSQQTLYFPCGVYEVKSMLTAYGWYIPGIVGANAACTRIRYTGTADVEHTLKIAVDAAASDYILGGTITGVSIEGNAHVTVAALGMYRPNTIAVRDVWVGPASSATGACLLVKAGVGDVYENIACDQDTGGLWDAVHPRNGLVFDGYSVGDQSTTSVVINPVIQGVLGTGLWMTAYSNAFAISGCQIAGNGQGAQVDGSLHTFDSCLFEMSAGGKSVEVTGAYNSFRQAFLSESSPTKLSITGKNVKFEGGLATLDVSIAATARNVTFDGTVLNATKVTDLAPDTRFDSIGDSGAAGGQLVNFPTHKQSPPNTGLGQGTFDTVVEAQGSWSASDTSPAAVFPNTFTTGKAWRAYFTGQVLVAGVASGQSRFFELTDTSNSIPTFSGNTISFAVNATTGKFTMSSTTAWQGFSGSITFVPLPTVAAGAEQSVSMQLAGTLKAAKLAAASGAYATTLQSGALGANNTLTLPTGTDTLVGKATADVLTNKTFDTASSGNVLKINGTQVSAVTGSGSVVLASSPTLTNPNIGTATGNITGNAATATALAADPAACAANQFVNDISATGSLTCAQPSAANLSNGVTGSGSVMLNSSPTLSNDLILGNASGKILLWSGSSNDTGISRGGTATVAVGNGTAGDGSGTIKVASVTSPSATNLFISSPADITLRAGSVNTVYLGQNGANRLAMNGANLWSVAAGQMSLGLSNSPFADLYLGQSSTNSVHFSVANTAARTVTIPDADITVSGAKVYACGSTTTCANTNNSATVRVVYGTVTLSSGSATVTGISPAFSSTSSFVCVGTDQTGAAAVKITNASGSSITISGSGSDVVGYHCVGS